MKLATATVIYAGGRGSGCNPEAGKCGRPAGAEGSSWSKELGVPTNQYYKDAQGHYTPERVKLHDAEMIKYQHRPGVPNPVVQLVLGGVASGKTSAVSDEYARLRTPAIVAIDSVMSDLPEFKQVMGGSTSALHEEANEIRDGILASALAHNNDIAMETTGTHGIPEKASALENSGYHINVAYVHRPVEDSIVLAANRAVTATDPADRHVVAESLIRSTHAVSRNALITLVKPGREVKIYDGTGVWDKSKKYPLIYYRTPDGQVLVKNEMALERMANSEEPKIPLGLFN